MSQPMPHPYYPPPPARPTPSGGLAISSLVLGIVGVVLSFMPIVNNLTAAGAIVGLVLGFVGIWKSKPAMSGIGVFLCGIAVVLTVVAQTQLGKELDQLGDRQTGTATATPQAAVPATDTPDQPTPTTGYAPAPGDFTLELVTLEEQCFGSAGCLVTFTVQVTYSGTQLPDPTQSFTAVYDVTGGSEPLTNRFTITGSQVSVQSEQMIQTGSPNAPLTATVTRTL